MDNNFLLGTRDKKDWIDDFIALIKKQKLRIQFSIFARPIDVVYHKAKLSALRDCGLSKVFLECHSFSKRQIKFLNKNTTVEANMLSLVTLSQNMIKYNIQLSLFEPTTTVSELVDQLVQLNTESILRHIDDNQMPITFQEPVFPLCRSAFEEYYRERNLSPRNYFDDIQLYALRIIILKWKALVSDLYHQTHKKCSFFKIDLEFLIQTCMELASLSDENSISIHLTQWYQRLISRCGES
jgi:hypothetical protein